jgi:hypothetical protein
MQVIDSQAPAAITPDAAPALCDKPKKLQQLVADAIAVRPLDRMA